MCRQQAHELGARIAAGPEDRHIPPWLCHLPVSWPALPPSRRLPAAMIYPNANPARRCVIPTCATGVRREGIEKGGRSPLLRISRAISALGELEALPGLGTTVFLALDDTRIAGEEPCGLERRP